jgi:hypothetical protein
LAASGLIAAALTAVVLQSNGPHPPPRPFTGSELAYTAYCFATGYSFGPSMQELQTLPLRQALAANATQLVLGFALVGATLVAWRRIGWRKAAPALAWLVAGVGFAVSIHFATPHTYHVRYALPALLGFVLLTARAVTLPHRTSRLLLAAHVVVCAWSCAQWFTVPKYGKEDTRAAVASLFRSAPGTQRVLVAPAYMQGTVRYYVARSGVSATVFGMASTNDVVATAEDAAVLITRPQHVPFRSDLDAALRQATQTQGWAAATTRSYRVYWAPRAR